MNFALKGKCNHEVPPCLKATTKPLSEYQTVFKKWPWQAMRQSTMPLVLKRAKLPKPDERPQMERKSTYGVDFGSGKLKKQARVAAGKVRKSDTAFPPIPGSKDTYETQCEICKAKALAEWVGKYNIVTNETIENLAKFKAISEYTDRYKLYNERQVKESKPKSVASKVIGTCNPITHKDVCLKTTVQDDSIQQENYEKPPLCHPPQIPQLSSKSIQAKTKYTDYYTNRRKHVHHKKKDRTPGWLAQKQTRSEYAPISTYMAAYTKHEGHVPMKPCQPPTSSKFITGKFEGSTTFGDAYQPWPTVQHELPSWAKKKEYVRPAGGMTFKSIYKGDYLNPEVTEKTMPVRPDNGGASVIEHRQPGRHLKLSTYNRDFKPYENVEPVMSYRTFEVYIPPTEKMACETNNRADFTGHHEAQKMLPCRHRSQHRELNEDQSSYFITTYKETFIPPYQRLFGSDTTNTDTRVVRINSAPNIPPTNSPCSAGFDANCPLPALTTNKIPGPLPEVTLGINQDHTDSVNAQ